MIGLLPAQPSPAAAARVLRQVFGHLRGPVAFRLWDGGAVRIGAGEPVCTAVIKSPETLLRLMRNPTPYTFAEAYIESAIDLEGDLFAAMEVANEVEELRLTPGQKLRALWTLWRG
jgi:cyclopropane-fatty-acyl-phospholipid synthase